MLGDDNAAISAFRRTLRFVADAVVYNNPWVPEDEMKNRIDPPSKTFNEAFSLVGFVAYFGTHATRN